MRIATVVFVLLMSSMVWAGSINVDLAQQIANSDPRTLHPTLIFMAEQFDVNTMKHQHDLIQASRAQRHADVVIALQNMATQTQADLLGYLDNAASTCGVGKYRGYWITNMIFAELNAELIQTIAARDDVAEIYADFKGELIKPIFDYGDNPPPVIARTEAGVRAIRAPQMWARGYTGAGRLVCNIDTGVDGSHPALNHSWRGANGHAAAESWLDSADPTNEFPHDEGQHGTHTMGTICGRSLTTADTVGVAIDAEWIACRAIDVTGGNISMAFEWAADPDGDPNTVDDVPDVISNSWGTIGDCPPSYYNLLDNCEAAGALVVFAAGNEGPTSQSLRIPANRVTTPYNVFSVGAIDGNNNSFPIASFSSRGPSQCDGQTIKPEVCAPGVNVRSSIPGGTYESGWSGTSMACPHVAGAVALLRQVNPNASVDTIKWALMQTAHDLPLSNPNGEDNAYGWGIIDVDSARTLIPPIDAPFIFPTAAYVSEPNDNYPDPGETVNFIVRLRNGGLTAANVIGIISTIDPFVTITQDSSYFGSIAQNDTARPANPFIMTFSPATPPGHDVRFDLEISADGDYHSNRTLGLTVGRPASRMTAEHNVGNVAFTVSNFGQYGLAQDGINPGWNGRGFKMPRTGTNNLFEGALFIGVDSTRVSNGARDQDQNIPYHFQPLATFDSLQPGPYGDEEFYTQFNDEGADIPMNIVVTQRSFAWSVAPNNPFVIVEYTITNSGTEALENLLVAHFEDWDIPWASPSDHVNFDRARSLGYQYSGSVYRGQQALSQLGVFSFKALDNANEVYPPHFTLADKWSFMNSAFSDTAITIADAAMMITTGPYTIAPGDSVVAAFSILGGTSLAILRTNADAAIAKYAQRTDIFDDQVIAPENFALAQNYPNPFNAQTTIRFYIAENSHVKLETFDLLGRKVATLVDDDLPAGAHSAIWDCGQMPSGIYFYRLTCDGQTLARKMTLLK